MNDYDAAWDIGRAVGSDRLRTRDETDGKYFGEYFDGCASECAEALAAEDIPLTQTLMSEYMSGVAQAWEDYFRQGE